MDNPLVQFLLTIACILGVIVAIAAVLIYLALRRLQTFVAPDISALQTQFAQLQTAQPNADKQAHVQRIIRQQAIKCGLVGAVAGFGGFVTLPIALPVDLLLSINIQATLVQFIASSYGQADANSTTSRLQTYLVTAGSTKVTETTFSILVKFIARLFGKSLSILVPVIGAVVGFAVNYTIAQATGQAALRWYARNAA
jgi:uncharacterized protein (DUF697 family)